MSYRIDKVVTKGHRTHGSVLVGLKTELIIVQEKRTYILGEKGETEACDSGLGVTGAQIGKQQLEQSLNSPGHLTFIIPVYNRIPIDW